MSVPLRLKAKRNYDDVARDVVNLPVLSQLIAICNNECTILLATVEPNDRI